MNPIDIKSMTLQERIQTMEQLWESISENNEMASPEWHREILDARRKKIESGEAKYITIDELRKLKSA